MPSELVESLTVEMYVYETLTKGTTRSVYRHIHMSYKLTLVHIYLNVKADHEHTTLCFINVMALFIS